MPKLKPSVSNRPLFVRSNINSIHDICKNLYITYSMVSRATGIPQGSLARYAAGVSIPDKERYNKLAEFFDWEVWT